MSSSSILRQIGNFSVCALCDAPLLLSEQERLFDIPRFERIRRRALGQTATSRLMSGRRSEFRARYMWLNVSLQECRTLPLRNSEGACRVDLSSVAESRAGGFRCLGGKGAEGRRGNFRPNSGRIQANKIALKFWDSVLGAVPFRSELKGLCWRTVRRYQSFRGSKMLNQLSRHCALFLLLAGVAAEGCANRSVAASIAIRIVEDTVVLQRHPEITSFKVTAVLRNKSSRTLVVQMCGTGAERQIDGNWVTVFMPFCASSGLSRLAAGDSVIIPVDVFGFTARNMGPRLDPRMGPGRYRLGFGIGFDDAVEWDRVPPSMRAVASPPFIVRD
jgi:hypothetical protein